MAWSARTSRAASALRHGQDAASPWLGARCIPLTTQGTGVARPALAQSGDVESTTHGGLPTSGGRAVGQTPAVSPRARVRASGRHLALLLLFALDGKAPLLAEAHRFAHELDLDRIDAGLCLGWNLDEGIHHPASGLDLIVAIGVTAQRLALEEDAGLEGALDHGGGFGGA